MVTEAQRLVRGQVELGSLPTVYERLSEVTQRPRCSSSDIAATLAEDPGVTARLLRLVNSAVFGIPREVDTVTRAVTLIGTDQLRELVLATSVIAAFRDLPATLISMEGFWRHSIACGAAARSIALQRGEFNAEAYFVAGLLHDVGSLVLYLRKPAEMREVLERSTQGSEPAHQVERELIGTDHAEVGGALLAQWRLPARLSECVALHHSPRRAQRFAAETAAVHVADVIAHGLALGAERLDVLPPLCAEAWTQLELDAAVLPTIVEETLRYYEDAAPLLLEGMA